MKIKGNKIVYITDHDVVCVKVGDGRWHDIPMNRFFRPTFPNISIYDQWFFINEKMIETYIRKNIDRLKKGYYI